MSSDDVPTRPSRVAPLISECIRQFLEEYVRTPFLDLREANPQARLWMLLRQRITPNIVKARILSRQQPGQYRHEHDSEVPTSRVQLQMKIGDTKEVTDIIVFRADCPVTLTCYRKGPADVVAQLCPEQIEAAIEIKAAPSLDQKDRGSFAGDVMKLHNLQSKAPHIHCFFLLLDKSLSVSGARSNEPPWESWREQLCAKGFGCGFPPSENHVEAWDLMSGDPPSPRVEYWSKRQSSPIPAANIMFPPS